MGYSIVFKMETLENLSFQTQKKKFVKKITILYIRPLTLKQTNKLKGIVIITNTHDNIINARPHDNDSPVSSPAKRRRRK